MLLNDNKEEIKQNYKLFEVTETNYQCDWHYYTEQYRKTVLSITQEGSKCIYQINCRFRPFLFFIRHYFELLLKSKLINPPSSHTFSEIYKCYILEGLFIPQEIKNAISIIDVDLDGSCYRYFEDKEGNYYFKNQDRFEIFKLFELYNELPDNNIFKQEICNIKSFDNKTKWEFTGHLSEIYTNEQLRTQYDLTLELFIKLIITKSVRIDDIFLPFLFLIRHSLELALKGNIKKILIIETNVDEMNKKIQKLKEVHSLATLYNIYSKYLQQLNFSNLDSNLKNQYDDYVKNYEKLNDAIHCLDSNSRNFRYPIERKINLKQDTILNTLELYYFTDTFITFTVDILKEYEVIPFSEEELMKLYGYDNN